MAEAIARVLGGTMVDARSAGISPLGWVSEQTIDTLEALEGAWLTVRGLDCLDGTPLVDIKPAMGGEG